MSSDGTPDRPIVAWRAWVVDRAEDPVRLRSFNQTLWTPFETLTAACLFDHDPPGESCKCGIYAARDRAHLLTMGYHDYDEEEYVVIGSVDLWGGIVPGDKGWRAQFAYPRKVLVPFEIPEIATALKQEYGVPVRLANTLLLTPRGRR